MPGHNNWGNDEDENGDNADKVYAHECVQVLTASGNGLRFAGTQTGLLSRMRHVWDMTTDLIRPALGGNKARKQACAE